MSILAMSLAAVPVGVVHYATGGLSGTFIDRVWPPAGAESGTGQLLIDTSGQIVANAALAVALSPFTIDMLDPANVTGGLAYILGVVHSQPRLMDKARVMWDKVGNAFSQVRVSSEIHIPAAIAAVSVGAAVGTGGWLLMRQWGLFGLANSAVLAMSGGLLSYVPLANALPSGAAAPAPSSGAGG